MITLNNFNCNYNYNHNYNYVFFKMINEKLKNMEK